MLKILGIIYVDYMFGCIKNPMMRPVQFVYFCKVVKNSYNNVILCTKEFIFQQEFTLFELFVVGCIINVSKTNKLVQPTKSVDLYASLQFYAFLIDPCILMEKLYCKMDFRDNDI